MSKGFDGWQNYYFDPEYDDEGDDGDEYDDYIAEDSQQDFSYEFETMYDGWEHYKDTEGWEEYKPNIWQRFHSWLRWHWHYKWWNACPDCHRPSWWGKHDNCIPF